MDKKNNNEHQIPGDKKDVRLDTEKRVQPIRKKYTKSKERNPNDPLAALFIISDIDPNEEEQMLGKRKSFKKKFAKQEKMSLNEFEFALKKVGNCCLKHIKDLHELHLKRTEALDLICLIIDKMDIKYVSTHHVVHMIWSIMSCIHHFQLRFRSGTRSLVTWVRKKKAEQCMQTYSRFIHLLPKSGYRVVLNSMILFYKEGKLWTIEFRLRDMLIELLSLYHNTEEALEDILSTAEHSSLTSDIEPRMLIKVVYETLEQLKWSHISEQLLRRFLIMLRKSIVPKKEDIWWYAPMRSGLNLCLRNITKNLNNRDLMTLITIIVKKITFREMEDDALLEFGSIAEYAALRYRTRKFSETIPEELAENLMIMMASENPFHHLFAFRIAQNIADRQGNRMEFQVPKIYFKGVRYNIKIAKYSSRDRQYFKKFRLKMYHVLIAGLQSHYDRQLNMENMYTYLAIVCVEVPCAYVASSTVSFAMALQEFILQTDPKNMVASHHIHAIVVALMTLVCNVFKAEVFYNYVTLIMERRSEMAPHLNPPIKASYTYAEHHILWNKPDLFFEDWEARYGLWKCFRTRAQKKKKSKRPSFIMKRVL